MKVVLFVPGRAPGSWPVLGPLGLVLTSTHCLAQGPSQAQRAPPLSRQPGPLGDMPRRATGGRQGGGTLWHHQTTAPGGRWQHKVEMPRAVQPEVRREGSSAALPRHCQAGGPEGPGPPLPRPPQPKGQLSPGSNSSPLTFLSSREPETETQVLSQPQNPCPSCRKLATNPGQV